MKILKMRKRKLPNFITIILRAVVDKKLDFEVGDKVISDCGTEIECLVTVIELQSNNLFAVVEDANGYSWEISTNKLKKIQIL